MVLLFFASFRCCGVLDVLLSVLWRGFLFSSFLAGGLRLFSWCASVTVVRILIIYTPSVALPLAVFKLLPIKVCQDGSDVCFMA